MPKADIRLLKLSGCVVETVLRETMENCLVCGSSTFSPRYDLREMFFGTRQLFQYKICLDCESIQLDSLLSEEELKVHYPSAYYAFAPPPPESGTGWTRWKMRRRAAFTFQRFDSIGFLLSARQPDTLLLKLVRLGLRPTDRVLDVGCGNGLLLTELAARGMKSLTGVDPFIDQDVRYGREVAVLKRPIEGAVGPFDYIMFNHALEHVPDPVQTLRAAADLLGKSGTCMVRIPTCSSEAYRVYGENWLQLDPPRHTFVPSRLGMERLGALAGLELIEIVDDSLGFQFWGSEQYKRDVPLVDGRSHFQNGAATLFSSAELETFDRRSNELNAIGDGDQAAFVFKKATRPLLARTDRHHGASAPPKHI